MASHKAAFDAGEVERLVILVVVILGAEVFIPIAGHILLEELYKVFEEFEAILSQFIAELATGDDKFYLLPDALSCNMQIVNKMGLKFQQNLLKVDTNIVLYQNLVDDTILQI